MRVDDMQLLTFDQLSDIVADLRALEAAAKKGVSS